MGQWYEVYPREGEKLTIQHAGTDAGVHHVCIERRLWDPFRKRFWKVEAQIVALQDVVEALTCDYGIEETDAYTLERPFLARVA